MRFGSPLNFLIDLQLMFLMTCQGIVLCASCTQVLRTTPAGDDLPMTACPQQQDVAHCRIRVVCLGLSRTGTFSMKTALELLDKGPCYHMSEVIQTEGHAELWQKVEAAQRAGEVVFRSIPPLC